MTTQTKDQSTQIPPVHDKESANNWGKEELVKIQKYCFSQGIQFKGFKKEQCLSIPSVIGIWYLKTAIKGEDYWVISGQFSTDIAPIKVAKNARDVCRYFAMSWQLKAARIEEALAEGKVQFGDKEMQQKIVEDLIKKAEVLASIHSDEKLWKNTGFKIS